MQPTYVIVPKGMIRPFKPYPYHEPLIFSSIQDAMDYGVPSTWVFPAADYGIQEAMPNIRVIKTGETDCTFEFRYGDTWR